MSSANKVPSGAMELTLPKADLLSELSVSQAVADRKSTVPILTNFLLETNGNRLLITATDLDLSLRTSCPAKVKTQGSCTIPARKFYEYVRLLQDGDVTIKLLDNNWVQIKSGRSNTKMVGMAGDSYPSLPLFPANATIPLPASVLRSMITKTMFAISHEESRYTLNGALLVLRSDGMTMVATDGHRLALVETANCKLPLTGDERRVLISKKALVEIDSLLRSNELDVVSFAHNEATLFFLVNGRLLTCRQISGNFPNYQNVLPRDLDKTIAVSTSDLSRALQRVAQFSDERSSAVRLQVAENQLRVFSSSPEAGESEDVVETSYGGQLFSIGFNSSYLLDFMKVAGSEKVTFHFKEATAAGEFHPLNNDGCSFRYVVMPMRAPQ
jgi:DNA polymerase-3 subunit beta